MRPRQGSPVHLVVFALLVRGHPGNTGGAVAVLAEESRAHQRTAALITRITFTPECLQRRTVLRFRIR